MLVHFHFLFLIFGWVSGSNYGPTLFNWFIQIEWFVFTLLEKQIKNVLEPKAMTSYISFIQEELDCPRHSYASMFPIPCTRGL